MSVAEAVGAAVAALGCRQVFGVVGSGNFVVTRALAQNGARFLAARHETAAVTMADAWLCCLNADGFESRLADRVNSTVRPVETVSIDGLPATLGAYRDTDWWVLLEPEAGRALELRIAGDRATVDRVLSQARFVDDDTWDAATNSP